MGQKYIFKDKNFVKCLRENGVEDRSGNIIKLDFKETNDGWELVSPQEIIDSVISLKCDEKQIEDISGIGNFKNSEVLYLDSNNLVTLSDEIGNLKRLKKLYLYNNNLTTLPSIIGNLENLEELYLTYNDLTSLPPKIGNLKNLKVLELEWNKLTTLPKEITNLKRLKELCLAWNPSLGHISKNFIRDWKIASYKVVDADNDGINDTVLCIQCDGKNYIKLWIEE